MLIQRDSRGLVCGLLPIGNDSLRHLHVRGLDVRGFDFSNQDMREVKLWMLLATGCKMHKTDLLYASLRYARLNRADLRGAMFDHCDLTSAVFCKSDLRGTSFRRSNLYCADFGDAIIDETTCFDGCVNRETASFKTLSKRGTLNREKCVDPTPPFNMLDTIETEVQLRESLELMRMELGLRPSEGLIDRIKWTMKKLDYKRNRQYANPNP